MMVVMVLVVVVLMLLGSRWSLMTGEVGLLMMVEMVGVEEVIEGHSAEELPEDVHRIFEDEVEMSLTRMMMVMMAMMVSRSSSLRHEGILEPVELVRFSAVLLKTGVSVLVVDSAFLGIGEDLISFTDFLEFLLGHFLVLSGVLVGMPLECHLSIRFFHFIVAGTARNS